MDSYRRRNIFMLIINSYLVLSTVVIVYLGITGGAGAGQVGSGMKGLGYLKAFTNLSNIYAAICSAVVLKYNIRTLKSGTEELPRRAVLLQYTGASAVALTFVIVVGFLGPMFALSGVGYFFMFSNDMFFFHFLNPVLCGVCFVMLETEYRFGVKENLFAIVPTILYSIVYAFMVVVVRRWDDFYNFTFGGHFELAPVIMLVMYLISFLLAMVLRRLHNARIENQE